MKPFSFLRRPLGVMLAAVPVILMLMFLTYPAAANFHMGSSHQSRAATFQPRLLRDKIKAQELASTVQVLQSQ